MIGPWLFGSLSWVVRSGDISMDEEGYGDDSGDDIRICWESFTLR